MRREQGGGGELCFPSGELLLELSAQGRPKYWAGDVMGKFQVQTKSEKLHKEEKCTLSCFFKNILFLNL